jgi:hypothetical protein
VSGEVNYGKAHPFHCLENLVTTTQHNDLFARRDCLDRYVAPLGANSGPVHVTCVLAHYRTSRKIAATAELRKSRILGVFAEMTTIPKRSRRLVRVNTKLAMKP